ncbi:hypothetical protein E8E11_007742 [Didymella keratinophila]|nr:hypothetical protein E8E11_007742 [Didymella keratinophila]
MLGPRGSNVGLTDAQRAALTPEQVKPMAEGSKAILTALFVYATGLWAMKGQVLFLYRRFTRIRILEFVAVLCVNAPCVKPLFSSTSWLKGSGYSAGKKYNPDSDRNEVLLHKVNKDLYPITDPSVHVHPSTEHINRPNSAGPNTKSNVDDESKLQIQRTTKVEVTSWDPVNEVGLGRLP